jgi:Ser/Thr protein kinase RdoA (MazF antagonist)
VADFAGQVAAAFAIGRPTGDLTHVARGEQGTVWRLDTTQGSYAVKEPFVPVSESDAAVDVAYQEAVLSGAAVSMPRPLRTSSGSVLAMGGNRLVRLYEWVDLQPAERGYDPGTVGQTVAAIHRVRHEPARPIHPWYIDPVGASVWHDLGRRASAARAPFADAFAQVIPTLVELETLLDPPRDLQNCHRDLFADNVLPMAQGGLCVIDWENCGLEDPSHELAVVMFDFSVGDPTRSSTLYDAYVDAGGPGRLAHRGAFSMLIAQFGHFFEGAAQEWLDPKASDEDRDHALSRFDELFRTPLTTSVIDQILDAVA